MEVSIRGETRVLLMDRREIGRRGALKPMLIESPRPLCAFYCSSSTGGFSFNLACPGINGRPFGNKSTGMEHCDLSDLDLSSHGPRGTVLLSMQI